VYLGTAYISTSFAETYFLSVILAADARAGPFLQFQVSSCMLMSHVEPCEFFDFPGSFFDV
jgi:hypothetical protein